MDRTVALITWYEAPRGCNLLVTLSFLTFVRAVGLSWTFWAYGLVSVGGWLFAKRFVPETKGRSLEQSSRS